MSFPIGPLADVPEGVGHGRVTGYFVRFMVDMDATEVPDEIPLEGRVIFTPTVQVDAAKVATDSAITSLTLLMEAQAKRIDALEEDFAALEEKYAGEQADHAVTAKKKRVLEEKYSAACEWILVIQTAWEGLKMRLAAIDFEHREIPPLPAIVAIDLEPSEVAAKPD